jgi:hypothetical protein
MLEAGPPAQPGSFVPTSVGGPAASPVAATPPPDPTPSPSPSPKSPWPLVDTAWGPEAGLTGRILDAGPDEAQNIWAASQDTLFLLRPGQTRFQAFRATDGLHVGPFTDWYGNANQTSITALGPGSGGEVYVGYYGFESEGDPFQDTEAQKELGNADRVTFDAASGTLTVHRLLFRCDYEAGSGCWEDRSPRRMVFAHDGVAKGHLFIGFNHGVAHVLGEEIGDHVHPEIFWSKPGDRVEKLGEFYGVAPDAQGNLWMAGRYGVGLQQWNPVPHFSWVDGRFLYAFTIFGPGHGLEVPYGYVEDDSGVAVTPDGVVYISSFSRGLTRWDPRSNNYGTMAQAPAAPSQIRDIAADPDGTLWLVTIGGEVVRFDPGTGQATPLASISDAMRVVVDHSVTPRAVYISRDGGLSVIRAK